MTDSVKTMAYRQTDSQPWIGLPCVKNDGDASTEDMMRDAGLLGWNVRLEEVAPEVVGMDDDGNPVYEQVDSPSFKVLRDHPTLHVPHRLGIVGERYTEVQNEELAAMADVAMSGGATLDSCGHWDNGRRVFLSFRLGDDVLIGGSDAVSRWFTVLGGHGGGVGISFFTGDMRIRCQNMLLSARTASTNKRTMRHTPNVKDRMLALRSALDVSFKAGDVFKADMDALASQAVTDAKFQKIIEGIYKRPEKDVKGSLAKWERKVGELTALWNGDTLSGLDNTAYKAYNALNEHLMWYPTVRAGNVEGALVKASGFDDQTNQKNLSLYKQVLLLSA